MLSTSSYNYNILFLYLIFLNFKNILKINKNANINVPNTSLCFTIILLLSLFNYSFSELYPKKKKKKLSRTLASFSMDHYGRQQPYGDGGMQIQPYHGGPRTGDFRSYSASYATATENNIYDIKKEKSIERSKSWGITDPELLRKKRVASYKMYSVEGKVKGSFRKSFRWLKQRYTQVLYG